MSDKKPGQLAWETYQSQEPLLAGLSWDQISRERQAQWAAVEAAIRADERERAAAVADAEATELAQGGELEKAFAIDNVAAAIRASGEKP